MLVFHYSCVLSKNNLSNLYAHAKNSNSNEAKKIALEMCLHATAVFYTS